MARIIEATLAASAARTVTTSFDPGVLASGEFSSLRELNASAIEVLEVVIVATALAATPSVTPSIEVYNPASATWVAVLTGTAITTAAPTTVTLRVGPYITAAANVAAQALLGRAWRLTMTAGDADSLTYSAVARVYLA